MGRPSPRLSYNRFEASSREAGRGSPPTGVVGELEAGLRLPVLLPLSTKIVCTPSALVATTSGSGELGALCAASTLFERPELKRRGCGRTRLLSREPAETGDWSRNGGLDVSWRVTPGGEVVLAATDGRRQDSAELALLGDVLTAVLVLGCAEPPSEVPPLITVVEAYVAVIGVGGVASSLSI
jgi:hypothetical protein